MHRCHGVECIVDRHLDFIAAVHADNWPENWRRVAIGSRRLPVNERVPAGHHLEVDRIPLFGCVDECRDWQTGIERRGISKAVSRTDKSTRCECSAADCKVASCQGHGLRGICCTISRVVDGPRCPVSPLANTSRIVIAKVAGDRVSCRSV